MLMLDGTGPLDGYRPYCDPCGGKLADSPLTLGQARNLASEHAWRARHGVRIEPWESYHLVEFVPVPAHRVSLDWTTPDGDDDPLDPRG